MGSFTVASGEADESLHRFLKRRLPIVEISDHYSVHYEVDRVSSTYYEATTEAMSYLLSLKHRRIGLIYGAAIPELATDRSQPYHESLQAAGLPIEQDLIIECGPTIEDGYQAASRLLELRERLRRSLRSTTCWRLGQSERSPIWAYVFPKISRCLAMTTSRWRNTWCRALQLFQRISVHWAVWQ